MLCRCDDSLLSVLLGETDVDCGGRICADRNGKLCPTGLRCKRDADCVSGNCLQSSGTCAERAPDGSPCSRVRAQKAYICVHATKNSFEAGSQRDN